MAGLIRSNPMRGVLICGRRRVLRTRKFVSEPPGQNSKGNISVRFYECYLRGTQCVDIMTSNRLRAICAFEKPVPTASLKIEQASFLRVVVAVGASCYSGSGHDTTSNDGNDVDEKRAFYQQAGSHRKLSGSELTSHCHPALSTPMYCASSTSALDFPSTKRLYVPSQAVGRIFLANNLAQTSPPAILACNLSAVMMASAFHSLFVNK